MHSLWHNTGANIRTDAMQPPAFSPEGGIDSQVIITCTDVDYTILVSYAMGTGYPTPPTSIDDPAWQKITYDQIQGNGGFWMLPIPGTYPQKSAWVARTFDNNEARLSSPVLSAIFTRESEA